MGRLILCADDFGITEGVSRTIADLARAGKLNAISCMAASPRWPVDAALLADVGESVEIGLHLLLTDEPALGPSTRPTAQLLTRSAILRRLSRESIEQEVAAQFEQFERVMGRPPAFVDGHQHCHVLPGIRSIVIAETARRAPNAWIRTCEDRLSRIASRPFRMKAISNAVTSAGLSAAAARAGLRCNLSFAGLYRFGDDFEEVFPGFLKSPSEFHLVICHPGSGACAGDAIATARLREADALRTLPVRDLAASRDLVFPASPSLQSHQ